MGWDTTASPYEYHPERGIYFHEVFPRVLCGSQPRTPDDIALLQQQVQVCIMAIGSHAWLFSWLTLSRPALDAATCC